MPTGIKERQRRRKISLACEPCRERKSRCDGGKPICSTCQRRSLGLEQCVYKLDNARTASTDEYIRVLHDRIRRLERACRDANVDVPAVDTRFASEPDDPPAGIEGITPATSATAMSMPPQSMPPHAHTHAHFLADARRGCGSGSGSGPGAHHPASLSYLGPGRTRSISLSSPPNPFDAAIEDQPDQASSVTAMGTIIADDDVTASEDFYGSSSTASFLKEAFDSMKNHSSGAGASASGSFAMPKPPPVPSLNPQSSSRDARRDPAYYLQAQRFALPPRELGDHLMDRFKQKVYYMYPFFHLPSFENAYRSLWQSNPDEIEPGQPGLGLGCYPDADATSIVFHCALNAIFALSCHFSDLPPVDRLAASYTFFHRAKSFVGLDLIEANNLGVVQAMLIVSLTLQSTPFPSRCWNATGLACRVAQGLGLHTEHRQDGRDDLEKEIRRRTWHGCVIMDMLVSMTYGRPTMTTQIPSLPLPCGLEQSSGSLPRGSSQTSQISPRFRFYVESIRLCGILEEILSKVYQPWVNRGSTGSQGLQLTSSFSSLDTIIGLHAKLSKFEASLPAVLSWTKTELTDDLSPEDESLLRVQRTVLYARFIYLRIMLLRPILTQLCMKERASMVDSNAVPPSMSDPLLSGTMLHCAKSCVEASVELLDLVHSTYQGQATGAWWWDALYACTAGLVLVIARTCPSLWPSLDRGQMISSWDKCEEILKFVASFSESGQKSLMLLQLIHGIVHSGHTSKQHSPPGSPKGGLPNDITTALLQAMPFEPNAEFGAGGDFQAIEDLGVMGTLFNWDPSFLDAAGGPLGGDMFPNPGL